MPKLVQKGVKSAHFKPLSNFATGENAEMAVGVSLFWH